MKTLWIFINLQILSWCAAMTLAQRHADPVFPRDAYIMGGGAFLVGLLAFLWVNPKIDELAPWMRVGGLLVFIFGLYYVPIIVPLLEAKWGIL